MLDHDTELRHEIAASRMDALRRSAEPLTVGRLRRAFGFSLVRLRPRPAYVALIACVLVTVLAVAGRASAFVPPIEDDRVDVLSPTSTPLELVFVGGRAPAAWSDLGWRHEGTFTATAPFCGAGTAADVLHELAFPDLAVRALTCGDGSGSLSLHVASFAAEEAYGGTGTWRIVGGTGRYATLRGAGIWGTVTVDPADLETLGFRTTLTGVVGFDAEAPRITFERAWVTRSHGTGVLRVAFSARDNARTDVSYRVTTLADGRVLDDRIGTTTNGSRVSLTKRIPVRRTPHKLRVVVVATDSLGNSRRIAHTVPATT